MTKNTMIEKNDGVLLNLRVSPNSDKFEILGLNEWRGEIKVKVSSPARKGKANEELLDRLGNLLEKDTEIISGVKNKSKKILVKRAQKNDVRRKLNI